MTDYRLWLSIGSLVLFTSDFLSDIWLINEYKNDPKLSSNYWAITLPFLAAYIITNFSSLVYWIKHNHDNPSARWWCWFLRLGGIIFPGHWITFLEESLFKKCVLEVEQIRNIRERKVEIVETVAESAPQMWIQAFIFAINVRKGRTTFEDLSMLQIFSSITSVLDVSYKTFGDLTTSVDAEASWLNILRKSWRPFIVLARTICFVIFSVSILEHFNFRAIGWSFIFFFVIVHYIVCAWHVWNYQWNGKNFHDWLQLLFVSLLNVYSPVIFTGGIWRVVSNKYTLSVYVFDLLENLFFVHVALLLSNFHPEFIMASFFAGVSYVIGVLLLILRLLRVR